MIPYRPAIYVAVMLALPLTACSKKDAAPYAVEEVPLAQISTDLASGKTSSVAVTKAYMERIKMYDGALHAVIMVAPDALEQAAASDKRRADKKALGPLDGVPIMVKDNLDAVGMPTTAGSYALADNRPAQDSEAVRRLRAAGAIIMGKLNMSQFAGLRNSMGLQGSTVGGPPHNPYDLTRSPGGSSSGSGIASSVSFAAATLGSDTAGSIIVPSALNGLVGMRPTRALISRRGIVPVGLTQDTTGPLARTVTDAAMLLTVVAGSDPGDPASKDSDAHKTNYVQGLNVDALRGAKLGVVRGAAGYSEKTQPAFDAALEVLKAQGAELVELPADILEDLSQEDRIILTHEFKDDLNAYLAATSPSQEIRTMTDLVAFNKADPRENTHAQDLIEASEATNGRQDEDYVKALEYATRRTTTEGLGRGLSEFGVNALVMLTTAPAAVLVPEGTAGGHTISERPKGSQPPTPSMNAAIAGYPDLTVPIGMVEGLPLGMSFIGAPWSEQTLLAFAYAYEQASHKRVPPEAYKPEASKKAAGK